MTAKMREALHASARKKNDDNTLAYLNCVVKCYKHLDKMSYAKYN